MLKCVFADADILTIRNQDNAIPKNLINNVMICILLVY